MQGVKCEAVVIYAEPLTTQQMRYHRVSRRVNNKPKKALNNDVTGSDFLHKLQYCYKWFSLFLIQYSRRVVYATLGFAFRGRTSLGLTSCK